MKFQVLPTLLKDQLKYSNKVKKWKLPRLMAPISRLSVLAAPMGSRPKEGLVPKAIM